jgi:transposase-like protein
MFRSMAEQFNEEKRHEFEALVNDGQYTDSQKNYAFELIAESGIRATARILKIPRRTVQRWCKRYGIFVKRCPSWVYGWAERRRKRRELWHRRGYC